jgi:hypothetical protein
MRRKPLYIDVRADAVFGLDHDFRVLGFALEPD